MKHDNASVKNEVSTEQNETDQKKKKSDLASGQAVGVKKYTDQEMSRIHTMQSKIYGPQPPSFKKGIEEGDCVPVGGVTLHVTSIMESFGTTSSDLIDILTLQIENTFYGGSKIKHLNAAIAVLHGIKPKDEIEALLATQMIACHNFALEFMRRAIYPEQTTEGVNFNTERATKMMRTFTSQMEALNRHRGKGQQKMTVKYIHVHEGGQAIVGQLNSNKEKDKGEGDQ